MDRRQRKTREAIFEAFSLLLAKKEYGKITVQEIIDAANVGRTTFYAHFETKDDLLKALCDELFQHVFSEALLSESNHDFSMKTGNPQAMITHILYHLLDNKRNMMGILSYESGHLLLIFFRQYLNKLMAKYMLNGVDFMEKNIPEDFLLNHISTSFVGMVQWWIKNNYKQSPEQLAAYFMAVTTPVIDSIL